LPPYAVPCVFFYKIKMRPANALLYAFYLHYISISLISTVRFAPLFLAFILKLFSSASSFLPERYSAARNSAEKSVRLVLFFTWIVPIFPTSFPPICINRTAAIYLTDMSSFLGRKIMFRVLLPGLCRWYVFFIYFAILVYSLTISPPNPFSIYCLQSL